MAGTITIFLGGGELKLVSSEDVSEAFPVTDIQTVIVRDAEGIDWLEGSFSEAQSGSW